MSSDNFHFHARSGNIYTNLSASQYFGGGPLTEEQLVAAGYEPTEVTLDEIHEDDGPGGLWYTEYGVEQEREEETVVSEETFEVGDLPVLQPAVVSHGLVLLDQTHEVFTEDAVLVELVCAPIDPNIEDPLVILPLYMATDLADQLGLNYKDNPPLTNDNKEDEDADNGTE